VSCVSVVVVHKKCKCHFPFILGKRIYVFQSCPMREIVCLSSYISVAPRCFSRMLFGREVRPEKIHDEMKIK
jgi:hypothetical protein